MSTTADKGVKQPTDHKPKADKPKEEEPRIVEVRGVDYTVEPEALNDFELLDDLNEVDQGSVVRMPSLLRRLLGPVQAKAAMETLRNPDTNRITIEAGRDFLDELMEALNPN